MTRALPGLHVVTDDGVLATDAFTARATALLEAHGPDLALHLRGPGTSTRRLHALAAALAPVARAAGTLFLVNDRADVALAADADGVQLAERSLPVAAARSLKGSWVVGVSLHGEDALPRAEGADFVVLGTIWETASHPGRPGAGPGLVRAVAARTAVPVVAIGGVTPERAVEAREAGARGVAVLRGVWSADAPARAAGEYLDAWTTGKRDRG